MQKLGNSLGTTVNHYNNAHKELGKVDKDVVKIAGNDPSVESLAIDRPAIDKKIIFHFKFGATALLVELAFSSFVAYSAN